MRSLIDDAKSAKHIDRSLAVLITSLCLNLNASLHAKYFERLFLGKFFALIHKLLRAHNAQFVQA